MQSTLEYLEVSRGISEYLRDLDLVDEWRLTRRWVRVWIVESSSVWGDIRSVVEMECVWNLETRIFRRRGWNLGVSPNRNIPKSQLQTYSVAVKFCMLPHTTNEPTIPLQVYLCPETLNATSDLNSR